MIKGQRICRGQGIGYIVYGIGFKIYGLRFMV